MDFVSLNFVETYHFGISSLKLGQNEYVQGFLDFRGSLGEKEVRESPNP